MSWSHQTHLGSRTWKRRIVMGIFALALLAGAFLGPMRASGIAHALAPYKAPAILPYNDNGNTTHEKPPLDFYNATSSSSLFVQHHPRLYLIFWGNAWNSDTTTMNTIVDTLKALAGSAYNQILTQYTDNSGSDGYVHNDVSVAASVIDSNTPPGDMDLGWFTTPSGTANPVFGAQGVIEAREEIIQHNWPVNQDSQVLIFPQKGTTYLYGSGWCGIHSWDYWASAPHALAFVQYGDNSSCNTVGDTAHNIAWTAVHEYTEMATDPQITADSNPLYLGTAFGGGWHTTDSSITTPEEAADLCEGYTPSSRPDLFPDYTDLNTGLQYNLPYLWSNASNGCVPLLGGTRGSSFAVSQADGVVDAFYEGTDYGLHHDWYTGDWNGPSTFAGTSPMLSEPRAVTSRPGVVDVFWEGMDLNLWRVEYTPAGGWSAPENLGYGSMGGPPSAVAEPDGTIGVFWAGSVGGGIWAAWDRPGSGWSSSAVKVASAILPSNPAPVTSRYGTWDVFWQGDDNHLWHTYSNNNGSTWTQQDLGMGTLGGQPSAIGQIDGTIGVFWPGTNEAGLWSAWYHPGSGWSGPRNLTSSGFTLNTFPVPVNSGVDTWDVFLQDSSFHLWHVFSNNNGSTWTQQELSQAGTINTPLFATGQPDGVVDVFWGGANDSHLWHLGYTPESGWGSAANSLGGSVYL